MTAGSEVALVLDTDYGERALVLAKSVPVWIVDSTLNRAAAEKAEREGLFLTLLYVNGRSSEDWLVNHADTVDQHHNQFSKPAHPYNTLRVIGATQSNRVKASLDELGFKRYEPTADGFYAHKA
jgi:hypothetical protein